MNSATSPSDDDLISRIRQRDTEALTELYDRYSTPVYSLAYAVTQNATLASETTQDTFMKMWNHIDQYTDQNNHFQSWLLVITRRCGIDLLRRDIRRYGQLLVSDVEFNFEQLEDDLAQQESRWQELKEIMSGLPAEQQEVIELSFYHGLSQTDIAAYLNVPLGTIKTRAALGMRKLRQIYLRS